MADFVNIVLGWIHILAVAIWIGGSILIDYVLLPSLGNVSPEVRGKVLMGITKKFNLIAWISVILIGVSGVARAELFGLFDPNILDYTAFGFVLQAKITLYLIMVLIGLFITRLGLKLKKNPSFELAIKITGRIKRLSEINIFLGVLVILLAVALRMRI